MVQPNGTWHWRCDRWSGSVPGFPMVHGLATINRHYYQPLIGRCRWRFSNENVTSALPLRCSQVGPTPQRSFWWDRGEAPTIQSSNHPNNHSSKHRGYDVDCCWLIWLLGGSWEPPSASPLKGLRGSQERPPGGFSPLHLLDPPAPPPGFHGRRVSERLHLIDLDGAMLRDRRWVNRL